MNITEVEVTKRSISLPHVCQTCGSMKDGAYYLTVDIADESEAQTGDSYVTEEKFALCVHHGCAQRFIDQLANVRPQCLMSKEVEAVIP